MTLNFNENHQYYEELNSYYNMYASWLESFRDKTFFITGINGMIGSALSDFLYFLNEVYNYNINIVAIVRSIEKSRNRFFYSDNHRINIYEFDVIDNSFIDLIMKNHDKIHYIIHAASNANPLLYSTDPVGTSVTNIIGMKNVLELAHKFHGSKVLYVSSAEAYGEMNDGLERTEEMASSLKSFDLRNVYPIAKLASESLCLAYNEQYSVKTIIARLVHTFGPTMNMNDNRAATEFIKKGIEKEIITLKSDGSQVRNYVYVFDVVLSFLFLLLNEQNTEIYNICNEKESISIKDFANEVSMITGVSLKYENPSNIERKGFNKNKKQLLNAEKLSNLGFELNTSITRALYKTIKIIESKGLK